MALLLLLLLAPLGLYLGACALLYGLQPRFIFQPRRGRPLPPETWALLGAEPVSIAVGRRQHLNGWWLPTPGADRAMLFCHGNCGFGLESEARFRALQQQGWSILAFEYRGYGASSGPFPNEVRSYADAEAALADLQRRSGLSLSRISLYGYSLGGAIAVELATRQPQLGGLILEGTFTRMRDMMRLDRRFRIFPERLLHQHFDSLGKLPQLNLPLLLIHAEQDRDVPVSMSQALYLNAVGPRQLCLVPEADHHNLPLVGEALLGQSLRRFRDLLHCNAR
jgi:pimeloyl-ACP methyl ester carboxylesterase